ncbi:MFS transporter [Herbaspirillum rhizosphaerae]|uniref:MFS transporter n=1 Tax=Herbaspirillum rhizosphaerae TaxID=346179 RepID=A0ABW8ZD14_9BURK
MKTMLNPLDEVGGAPIGRFHWTFGILIGFVMLFDGYDLFNAAYVIPLVAKTWKPDPTMVGIMLSSGIVGLSLGSVLQGLLADKFGRRKVLVAALFLLTICNVILALVVTSPWSFAFSRMALGTALGMITPLVITYINEWAPKKQSNTFTIWTFQVGFSLGGISAGIVGITLGQHFGWQSIYIVGSASLLVAIYGWLRLPESIQFLALRGEEEKIRKLLCKLRPDRTQIYRDAGFINAKAAEKRGSIKVLLSQKYRRATLINWVSGFLSLFCIHGLTGWLPSMVIQRGEAVSSAFAYGSLIMVASLFGGMSSGWFADKVHSRIKAMVVWYAAAAVAMAFLAMFSERYMMIFFVAAAGFFVFGAQAVLNNFQVMSYPTEVRGTGMGIAVGVNRLGGIMGPFLIGVLHTINSDPSTTFIGLGVALLLAALSVSLGRAATLQPRTPAPEGNSFAAK